MILNNDITATGTHDSIMYIYGIYFEEWEASGEVKENTIILRVRNIFRVRQRWFE